MTRQTTLAEEDARARVLAAWKHDKALRAEFVDNRDAAVAYFMALARGQAQVFKGKVIGAFDLRPSWMDSGPGVPTNSNMQYANRATGSHEYDGTREGFQFNNGSAERRWNCDASLRYEFVDDKAAWLAYAKREAAGQIRIFGGGQPRIEPPGGGAAAQASPSASHAVVYAKDAPGTLARNTEISSSRAPQAGGATGKSDWKNGFGGGLNAAIEAATGKENSSCSGPLDEAGFLAASRYWWDNCPTPKQEFANFEQYLKHARKGMEGKIRG